MLRKATITVEILYNEKEGFEPEGMTLEQLGYATTYGNMSGVHSVTSNEKLSIEESIAECAKQGSDPDFFGIPSELTTKEVQDFLDKYATKVQEHEDSDYVELMMDNHKCVEFGGVQYYVNEDTSYGNEEFIYDFLVDNYHL